MLDFFNIFGLELNLDWSWIYNLGAKPMYEIMWHFLINGGWAMFLVAFLYGGWINFVYRQQCKYAAKQSYVFLAVDIPKDILQTPRAVENVFSALAGIQNPLDWHERYLKGEFQLGLSMEIVSIEGFIQYIIRTPSQFRNLVEAAIYSQYPEAEITEVQDYTAEINTHFPSDEYNLWGADFVFTNKEYLPFRTYVEFQEELDKEFKDPMAAILEVMNKIGPGEQIWLQIMISPADIGWEKIGMKEVNKLMQVEEKSKVTVLDKITDAPLNLLTMVGDQIFSATEAVAKKEEKKPLVFLNPVQDKLVKAILRKIDKICFKAKVRVVYYAKKEVFKKGLAVAGMVGAFKQFGSTGLNAFKPGNNKTQAKLMFIGPRMAMKQNKILKDYKKRNPDTCAGKQLMGVEELATIYHFPYIEVKVPLVRKIEAKKSRAPIGLPVEETLPTVEEAEPVAAGEEIVPVIDYDSDYFEKRFAIDKTGESDRRRKEMIMKGLKKESKVKPMKNGMAARQEKLTVSKTIEPAAKSDGDDSSPDNLPII